MEKRLLITGFEPFGGETVNPSWQAVSSLPEQIGCFRLYKKEIPVVFGQAAQMVIGLAEEIKPHMVLCVGQAGGRSDVTPERFGVNFRDARIADNAGKGRCPYGLDTPSLLQLMLKDYDEFYAQHKND